MFVIVVLEKDGIVFIETTCRKLYKSDGLIERATHRAF